MPAQYLGIIGPKYPLNQIKLSLGEQKLTFQMMPSGGMHIFKVVAIPRNVTNSTRKC